MSHSENNLESQKRRHKGPLIGYIAIAIFVSAAVIWWATSDARGPQTLDDAPPVVDAPAVEGDTPAGTTPPATDTAPANTTPPATDTAPANTTPPVND